MNILLLSVSIGAGHIKAAEAVKEEVALRYPNSNVVLVDALKYVNPLIDKLVVKGYLKTLKRTPMLYKKLYEIADSKDNINQLSKLINKIMSRKICKLIKEYAPEAIVCTHPFPLQALSNLKKNGKTNIPLIAVLTDYIIHTFWKQDYVDAYIVAHEYMKHELTKKGVNPDFIFPIGIPVGRSFKKERAKEQILKEFNLEDKPTILIMGGSLGMGQISEMFLTLINSDTQFQIIVLAGANLDLIRKLHKLSSNSKNKVMILGHTDKVADLMSISDFLISKPGGLTISEALIKELPIIVISPIPGQEERNAQFLTNSGLGARIVNKKDMDCVLHHVINSPIRTKQMRELARYYAKPNAAKDVVDLLEKINDRQK